MYQVSEKLRFIGEAPVLKISALSGKGVHKLLPALSLSIEDYHRRVPTRRVNEVIRAAQQAQPRSEEHTSELQSLMRTSYAVFCLKKKNNNIMNISTNKKC